MMQYYSIVHMPTGNWLPQTFNHQPINTLELTQKNPPRLFVSIAMAKRCLNHWLNGDAYMSMSDYKHLSKRNEDQTATKYIIRAAVMRDIEVRPIEVNFLSQGD